MTRRGVRKLRPIGCVLLASGYSAIGFGLLVTVLLGVLRELGAVEEMPSLWLTYALPLAVAATAGLIRISVEVSDYGVVVRNVWRTYRLRWAEIREVSDSGGWRTPLAWLDLFSPLVITTADGRRIVIQASLYWLPDRGVRDTLRESIPAGHHVRWRMSFREEWEPEP